MRTTSDGNGRYRNRCSRRRKPGVDRLSKLPDSVLLHILSFLPIEDAVGTEVLSKRWKSLWTYSPSLIFRHYTYDDDPEDERPISYDTDIDEWIDLEDRNFAAFVDKTLLLSNCSKVDKLEFDFEYQPCLASNVDLWTRFAAVKGTEELHLLFHDENIYADKNRRYELPQHLFTKSLFRELNFRNCRVNPKGNIGWKSLKKLSIGEVRLSNELLEKILSSSPVLEMLELYRYQGFGRLHVNNASLKKLILRSYVGPTPTYEEDEAEAEHDNEEAEAEHDNGEDEADEADGAHGAEEDAADGGNALEEDLADGENPAEEDEADDWHGFEEDEGGGEQDPEGLEISPPHLQSLEISGRLVWNCQLINELSSMEAKGLSSPLLNCTSLTLEAWLDDDVFPWIATILGLSPNLETLVMTKSSSESYMKDKLGSYELQHFWTSQKRIFKCLSLHLKKVVFANSSWFGCESNFFSFVQFLLKNAKVLQKVIIHTSMLDDAMPKEFYVAANKLLTFPRSSPDAVVMFCK